MGRKATKDIRGKKFGKLTVVGKSEKRSNGHVMWECLCECGDSTYVRKGNLLNRSTISCGCLKKNLYENPSFRNLAGQCFGRLTALEPTSKRQGGSVVWKCQCACGNVAYVSASSLKSGNTKSCGCTWKERGKDLSGMRFGRLTAVRPTDRREKKYVVWECRCDCGNIVFVRSGSLINGNTQSCGCLWTEAISLRKNR